MMITNPMKAIRAKCIDCCAGDKNEVKLCTCEQNCALWPFRMGKNPYRKPLSEAQIAASKANAQRMKEARSAQDSQLSAKTT